MKTQIENIDEKNSVMRCGHAVVRISKLLRNGYTTHRLKWKVGKKTYNKSYNKEAAAMIEAERIVKHLATSDGAATMLCGEDIVYFNECRQRLGKIPLHVAVEFYLKFHEYTSANPKSFSEVYDAFYARAEERGLSQRYYQTLRHHRNVWEPEFGKRHIDTIAPEEYLAFLRASKYNARSKHNLFGTLLAMLRFARKQRFVSEDKINIDCDLPALRDETPVFYTPPELCRLFIATDRKYLPYVALMAFGGTRRSEASNKKLTMADVLFDEKMIRLGPEITKTRTGRTLDIPECLKQWLKEFGPQAGPIVPTHKIESLDEARLKACGVETKQNALRHSFCSYHLAMHRNAAMTAEIAGNSPAMLNKHYKALVSKVSAEGWFSITPERVRRYARENKLDGLLTW